MFDVEGETKCYLPPLSFNSLCISLFYTDINLTRWPRARH